MLHRILTIFWLFWLFPAVLLAVGAPLIAPYSKSLIDANPDKKPATIIDYLSADPQYSYFLRHVQRLGLIPTINKMQNVTVFATVNLAFVDSELALNDTKESLLRYFAAQKFRVSYLNGSSTILSSLFFTKEVNSGKRSFPLKVSMTPQKPDLKGPYMVNDVAQIVEYDAYVKHQHSFIQTIDHLIPLAVSMCDFLMSKSTQTHAVNGHHITFIKRVFQLIFSLKRPLRGQFPHTCDSFLASVSTFLLPTDRYIDLSLLDMEKRYLLTIYHGLQNPDLYPTKTAVHEVTQDALAFLLNLFLLDLVGGINGTHSRKPHFTVFDTNSYNVTYDKATDRVCLNGQVWSAAGSTALTLSDGVLHVFDADPSDKEQAIDFVSACNIKRVTMSPRKTLYAMHFSQLVRELKFYKKARLIGSLARNQTILIHASDRDDFFDDEALNGGVSNPVFGAIDKVDGVDEFEDSKDVGDSGESKDIEDPENSKDFDGSKGFDDSEGFGVSKDSNELDTFYDSENEDDLLDAASFNGRQQTMYKFIDSFVDTSHLLSPENPRFHALLNSKLCLHRRIDSCFKVKVSGLLQNGKSRVFFNDKHEARAPVVAAGNNAIYMVETDFSVPASLKNTLAQLISDDGSNDRDRLDHVTIEKLACLQTLKYLEKFALLSLKNNYHGYTIFLPCGRPKWDGAQRKSNENYVAWDSLGLILRFLEQNPAIFEKVLKGNFLEELVYSDFGLENLAELYRIVKTLNGENVNVSETFQEGHYNHVISINNTRVSVPLNSDVLFNQGVVHLTSEVVFPSDFRVNLRDLIWATHDLSPGHQTFSDFVEKFPKLAEMLLLDDPLGQSKYSLLVPTSDLLRALNITTDFSRLWEFLELHLISNNDAQILLKCMGIPFFESANTTYTIKENSLRGPFKCHTGRQNGKTHITLVKRASKVIGNLGKFTTFSSFTKFSTFAVDMEHLVRVVNYGCTQHHSANSSCVFVLEKPLELAWFDPHDNLLHVHIGWISVGIGVVIGVVFFGLCTTTVALCLSQTNHLQKIAATQGPLPGLGGTFKLAGLSYMQITSDDDHVPLSESEIGGDFGYETDVDMTRNETDALLPQGQKLQQKKPTMYRSVSPLGMPSAPRKIKKQGVLKSLARDCNMPPT